MRKVTLVGGPAAGLTLDSECSNIVVPVYNDFATAMPHHYVPLVKGLATYKVRPVRFGRMKWYVAPWDTNEPVHPLALMAARSTAYVFGSAK